MKMWGAVAAGGGQRSYGAAGQAWLRAAVPKKGLFVPTLGIRLEDELVDAKDLDAAALAGGDGLVRTRSFHLYPTNTEEEGGRASGLLSMKLFDTAFCLF